jgi:hypothetical protein
MRNINKLFESIYQETKNGRITSRDKIELMTDFINKMKNIVHQGQLIIKELEKEVNKY